MLQARNMTPALSAAGAICAHVRDWLLGTPHGEWVSMGVASDGSYGVPPGLFFSFPVTCQHGQWHIVQVRYSGVAAWKVWHGIARTSVVIAGCGLPVRHGT